MTDLTLSPDERSAVYEIARYAARCGIELRERFPNADADGLQHIAAREALRALDDLGEKVAGLGVKPDHPIDDDDAGTLDPDADGDKFTREVLRRG